MPSLVAFHEFLQRLKRGDAQAAVEFVRVYEPLVRVEARRRVNDPYLNRCFDSADVCQSVLASFFVRVTAGQFDFENPDNLLKLLLLMVRRKVASRARAARAGARDSRRTLEGNEQLDAVENGPRPDQIAAGTEMLTRCRELMSPEERQIADLRVEGRTWGEVAILLGGQAQARRRQFDRALDRISHALGLEDEDGTGAA